MRILILLLNQLNKNISGLSLFVSKRFRSVIFFLFYYLLFSTILFSQWNENPSINSNLIVDAVNPTNLSAYENPNGGTYFFWEDTKGNESYVYFQHLDQNGNVSFRADGKRLGAAKINQTNPVAATGKNGAVVIWKSIINRNTQALYAQKVESNGYTYWSDNGIEVKNSETELINYSVAYDEDGLSFIAYIEKSINSPSNYSLKVQRLSITGYTDFVKDGIEVANSMNAKNQVVIKPDNKGGFSVFWIEFINRRNVLVGAAFNSSGKQLWGPIEYSRFTSNVLSFRFLPLHKQQTYLIWQNLDKPRTISHQIINENGNTLWEAGGKNLSRLKGDHTNPQVITSSDSGIIVSWTHDINKDKNVFLQKFKFNGKTFWEENGYTYFQIDGDQFGQTIVSDGKGGAITAWLDRRDAKMQPNIYGQKIDKKGDILWDQSGTLLAAYKNSEKSYLNLVSDQNGGAIAIFKDKRESITSIFGQRIYATKSYTSLILDFNALQKGDSVILKWRSLNSSNIAGYQIEKFVSNEDEDSAWVKVGFINHYAMSLTNRYQFTHPLEEAGSHYYRIAIIDYANNSSYSDVLRVNFILTDSEDILVYQNIPNPFSDSTSIVYHLPNKRNIKFEIYNSRIEKIKEYNITETKTGNNRFVFEARNLPTGVYFYRFTAGEFVEVKKMVISR
jgi:hypothetical protein